MKTSLLRVSLAVLLCFSGSTAIFSQSILNILASATDLSCNVENGTPDGHIEIQVSGGTPAYTFLWTGPGVNPTSQNQAGLIAGTYYLTVTDSQGQTQSDEYNLSEPEKINISESIIQPSCNTVNGQLTGEINLTVSGDRHPIPTTGQDIMYVLLVKIKLDLEQVEIVSESPIVMVAQLKSVLI